MDGDIILSARWSSADGYTFLRKSRAGKMQRTRAMYKTHRKRNARCHLVESSCCRLKICIFKNSFEQRRSLKKKKKRKKKESIGFRVRATFQFDVCSQKWTKNRSLDTRRDAPILTRRISIQNVCTCIAFIVHFLLQMPRIYIVAILEKFKKPEITLLNARSVS